MVHNNAYILSRPSKDSPRDEVKVVVSNFLLSQDDRRSLEEEGWTIAFVPFATVCSNSYTEFRAHIASIVKPSHT